MLSCPAAISAISPGAAGGHRPSLCPSPRAASHCVEGRAGHGGAAASPGTLVGPRESGLLLEFLWLPSRPVMVHAVTPPGCRWPQGLHQGRSRGAAVSGFWPPQLRAKHACFPDEGLRLREGTKTHLGQKSLLCVRRGLRTPLRPFSGACGHHCQGRPQCAPARRVGHLPGTGALAQLPPGRSRLFSSLGLLRPLLILPVPASGHPQCCF